MRTSRSRSIRRVLLVLAFAALGLCAGLPVTTVRNAKGASGSSAASAPSATSAPFFAPTSPVLTFGTGGTASTSVAVENPGPGSLILRPAEFTLVTLPSGASVRASPAASLRIGPGAVSAITLRFHQSRKATVTGAVLDYSGSGPASVGVAPIVLTLANPAPMFVATSPVLTFATDGTSSTHVAVQNPGTTPLTLRPAEFRLVTLPSGLDARATSAVPATSVVPAVVGPGDVSAVTLQFAKPFATTLTGATLDFMFVPSPTDPVVSTAAATPIALTLDRSVSFWSAWGVPLAMGLAFAAITSIIIRATLPSPAPQMITAASGWKFSDSWATNITALGAALVTVATTTGAAAKILPGVTTAPFGILTAACGALVLLAPLFIAFQRFPPKPASQPAEESRAVQPLGDIPDGIVPVIDVRASATPAPGVTVSRRMLLVAAFITLTGVGVELATLSVLAHLSTATSAERLAIDVVLLAVGVTIGAYAIYTTYQLVYSQDSTGSRARSALNARSGLSGPGEASLTL